MPVDEAWQQNSLIVMTFMDRMMFLTNFNCEKRKKENKIGWGWGGGDGNQDPPMKSALKLKSDQLVVK